MSAEPIAYIPYAAYWSTPFARWQGALSGLHSVRLAALAATQAFAERGLEFADLDGGVLGLTVPQEGSFYGLPWLAGMVGAGCLAGPTVSQACATGARVLALAARDVAGGANTAVLGVCADRTSNSPHVYYPAPDAPGGVGRTEDWILANFERDPHAGMAMVDTAENVARRFGVSREAQDDMLMLRYRQYGTALANDRAFQRRYMLELALPDARFRPTEITLEGDEGVYPSRPDKVRALAPVREGGSVTHASQTHPADGNAGIVVANREKARALSAEGIEVGLMAFGQAREKAGHMPAAPLPASRQALAVAGVRVEDLVAITSHNPFAVNDVVFCRELGVDPEIMNQRGSSLIYGHPQAPTGLRAIIELIEVLVERGGGYGLFQGCAAGDSAMAVLLKVDG